MLKLGSETGSVVNHLMSRAPFKVPEVGEPATILRWTDRLPGTVTEVKTSKTGRTVTVTVREDDYTRVDTNGMSEVQDYVFHPNYNGRLFTFKSRDGEPFKGVMFGRREKYRDFSF